MFKSDAFGAVESKNLKSLRSILKKKPDKIHVLKNGDTLLHTAAQMESSELIEVLLQYGAKVDRLNSAGRTALHMACASGHFDGVVVLCEHNANLSIKCPLGNTPLHEAVKKGNLRIIKYIFNFHMDINAQNRDGWSALHAAVSCNRIDAAEILLFNGIDGCIRNRKGMRAFDMAIELMHHDMAELISKSAKKPVISIQESRNEVKNNNDFAARIGNIFNESRESLKNLCQSNHGSSMEIEGTQLGQSKDEHTNESVRDESKSFLKITQSKLRLLTSKRETSPISSTTDTLLEDDDLNKIPTNVIDQNSATGDVPTRRQDLTTGEKINKKSAEININSPLDKKENVNNDGNNSTDTISDSNVGETQGIKAKRKGFKLFSKRNTEQHSESLQQNLNGKSNLATIKKDITNDAQKIKNDVHDDDDDDDEEAEIAKRKEEEIHECPVCFEIPLPPTQIYQCCNGHLYCSDCMKMPNMFNCPQCGVDIASARTRNRYAEEIIERLYGDKKKV